jgi:hypothetical protein
MVTSNSGIDFISLAKASGVSPDVIMSDPDFPQFLRGYLNESVITVTFTKKDGTPRVMKCTKQSDLIPEDKQPKGTGTMTTGDAVAAFDLEKQEWRSFNTGNITHIEWGTV